MMANLTTANRNVVDNVVKVSVGKTSQTQPIDGAYHIIRAVSP